MTEPTKMTAIRKKSWQKLTSNWRIGKNFGETEKKFANRRYHSRETKDICAEKCIFCAESASDSARNSIFCRLGKAWNITVFFCYYKQAFCY